MKYRAFLSYSHADTDFAERFHKDLERWRAGRGLAGRETRAGRVPRDLRPIFRDRDDFAGGGALADATNEALGDSDFLIVLCSPAAAASAYVNEEIRSFKAMGGSDRIIPVIIDGEPGHPERNCFPHALLHKVSPDGEVTDEVEDRLAADARSQGDGPRRALAKVIAGLLGVPFDEIVRRAELAQRRRNRIYAAIAASMSVLALLAAGFGWLAETRRVTAERNYRAAVSAADELLGGVGEELIRTEGVSIKTTRQILGRAEGIYDQLIKSLPDSVDVKRGKITALGIFARAYYNKGDLAAAQQAAASAEALTEQVMATAPDDGRPQVPLAIMRAERARLLVTLGQHDEASRVLTEALRVLTLDAAQDAMDNGLARYVAGVGVQLALLRATAGNADEADQVMASVDRLHSTWAPKAPADGEWQVIEAASWSTRAAIAEQRGQTQQARDLALRSIEMLDEMVKVRPDWPQARVLLAQALRASAALAKVLGEEAAATAEAARADQLLQALAAADPEDRPIQVSAAARNAEQAVARIEAGDAAAAVPQFRAALATIISAGGAVPRDAFAADALRLVLRKATKALNDAKYHSEALEAATHLARLEEAAVAAGKDADARARLAYALTAAGVAADGLQKYQQALEFHEQALELERSLAEADSSRLGLLADAEWRSAVVLWRLSQREQAEARYVRLVAQFAQLADANPDNSYFGSSLTWTCVNLGELKALNGKINEAAEVFARCLANAQQMHKRFPDERNVKLDLVWSLARLALLHNDAQRWQQVAALLGELDKAQPLADMEDELLTVAIIAGSRR